MRAPQLSPMGEGREREVECPRCGRKNWNHSAQCWICIDRDRKAGVDPRNPYDLDEAELHDGEEW